MSLASLAVSNDLNDPESIRSRWGVTACEYRVNHIQVDLQDLLVMIAKNRAIAVEGEVAPQATRIRNRNSRLTALGEALAKMTEFQSSFGKEDTGNDDSGTWFDYDTAMILHSLGYEYTTHSGKSGGKGSRPNFYADSSTYDPETGTFTNFSAKRQVVEGMVQRLKSEIDSLNNESQLDMTRLQQLVDRRDESYSTATSLMTEISDTRSNLIRNY